MKTVLRKGFILFACLLFLPVFARGARAAAYQDSFGRQLTGEALKLYREMEQIWGLTDDSPSLVLSHTFPESADITFTASLDNGRPVLEGNESYRQAMEKIRLMVQKAYDAFTFDHPEVFWLSAPVRRTILAPSAVRVSSDSSLYRIRVAGVELTATEWYKGASKECQAFEKAVSEAASAVRSTLPAGASRAQTAWAVHDFISDRVSYGGGSDGNRISYTAAGVFLRKYRVICEGYAKAFKILCDRLGVPCVLIVGKASDNQEALHDHMWNYACLEDGKWYLTDLTWDDEKGVQADTYFLAGKKTPGFYRPVKEDHLPSRDLNGAGTSFRLPALSSKAAPEGRHLWEESSRKPSTCKKKGSVSYTCARCGKTKKEKLPLAAHIWEKKWTTVKKATVLEEGSKAILCSVCGTAKKSKSIPKLTPKGRLTVAKTQMKVGTTQKAKVVKMARGDSVVSWSSSAPSYLSVSGKGVLKAKKETGKKYVKIRARLASGLTRSLKIRVLPAA